MSEKILSPGVFMNESDQSLVQKGIQGAATAIVGPTVMGQPYVPTYVTSYSEYVSKFGEIFKSGSYYYEYFTSLAAKDFFQNGGQTLLVTRIISGSSTVSTYANSNAPSSVLSTTSSITISSASLAPFITPTGSFVVNGITIAITGSTVPANTATTIFIASGSTAAATIGNITASFNASSSNALYSTSLQYITASASGSTGLFFNSKTTAPYPAASLYYITSGSTTTYFSGATGVTSFILETIAWGDQMNNAGTETNGALSNGTVNNVRWEVINVNTGSGTFSIGIRAGNDNNAQKNYLETWPNLSLDPSLPNYISRVIGDLIPTFKSDSDGNYYVDYTGSYANASQYVRVKSVTTPHVDSLDNNGAFKATTYSGSLPVVASGSFSGGVAATNAEQKMGETITTSNIQGFAPADYNTAFSLLNNREGYKFNVLLAPGVGLDCSAASTMISTVENRGDAIAVVDAGVYGTSLVGATTNAAGQSSNYAATYYPWVQLYSANLGKGIWCPPSTIIGGIYAFNDQAGAEWYAPAGFNRGGVPSALVAEKKLSQANRDTLYLGNVNPLGSFPNQGVVVFGQKTLQKKSTALDRINVRRLLISLKEYIGQVATKLVFEQNTNATRNRFIAQVNPFLESVVQRNGLYAYKVVMNDSNNTSDVVDRNQLVGQIYIQPTKTAEFVILNFNVQPTGATFPA